MKTQELLNDAARKIDGYLASGIAGLLDQAWDRLRVAGIRMDAMPKTRAGAEHMRDHLLVNRLVA